MKDKKNDESLDFLNQFVELFEDVLGHDGYADMQIEIRNRNFAEKEVLLKYGKEHRFRINVSTYQRESSKGRRHFRVIRQKSSPGVHQLQEQPERRKRERRANKGPWNFRLERRINGDRRKKNNRNDL